MAKAIMYVGRKRQKYDNKNSMPNRVWQGLGYVIAVPDLDASKLLEHPDIWMDVTERSPGEREGIIAAYQKQYHAEARKQREGQVLTLDTATDEELEAAIKRRKAARGKVVVNPVDHTIIPHSPQGQKGSQSLGERDGIERPENSDDLAADVFGVLSALDKQQDFDSEGNPYLERVNERLGYAITQTELTDVYTAFKG